MTTSDGAGRPGSAFPGAAALGLAFLRNPAPMAVWTGAGDDFHLAGWNPALEGFMNGRIDVWLGSPASRMFETASPFLSALVEARDGSGAARADAWLTMPDEGGRRFVEAQFSRIEGGFYLATFMDATAMKLEEERLERDKRLLESALELRLRELGEQLEALERKERELRDSMERYEALTANIPFGVFRFRLGRDDRVKVEYVSERIVQLTGISRDDGMTQPTKFSDTALAKSGAACWAAVERAVLERQGCAWEGEAVVRGRARVLRLEVAPEPGNGPDLVFNGTLSDVTAEREERARRDKLLAAVDDMAQALGEFREATKSSIAPSRDAAWESFSERETQVSELLLLGLSNRELSGRLCISESTVKKHIASVFAKLGVSSRAELFLLSRR